MGRVIELIKSFIIIYNLIVKNRFYKKYTIANNSIVEVYNEFYF